MTKELKSEIYCQACECRILRESEKFGPICSDCYKKTRRRDPLMVAALVQAAVIVVPTVCPHHEEARHGTCRYFAHPPRRFNVIVLDTNLDPVRITAPMPLRAASKEAHRLMSLIERRAKKKKRGKR